MKASWRSRFIWPLLISVLTWMLPACGSSSTSASITIHLGYYTGIHHMAAHVGLARKTYEQALAPNKLETTLFNVGPDEINAMIAGSIDIGFIGSGPPVNGYVRSNGTLLRIIAGAASGGQLFIIQPDEQINTPADLHGKKIADPGSGGTQDVALRHYLQQHGLAPTDKGGDVQIVPGQNADSVNLFKQHQIDGAWIPEPFASRMVIEGHGKVFVNESDLWPDGKFGTCIVIVRTEFLKQHPDIVKAFLKAEVETIQYIQQNFEEAKNLDNDYLGSLPGGKKLSREILDSAFSHIAVTYDPLAKAFLTAAQNQYDLGFLGTQKPDLTGIYDLDPLNAVLKVKGLSQVTTT